MNLRVARELLHQYVREVFGGASGNYRQGRELRGIGDEPARFFRTETNFLIDDGTMACFFYSPQKPAK